jgi:hypothetical protein
LGNSFNILREIQNSEVILEVMFGKADSGVPSHFVNKELKNPKQLSIQKQLFLA